MNENIKECSLIKINYLYINNDELYHIKSEDEKLTNSTLSKERLLYLIKNNQYIECNSLKYKLVSILKYNMDIEVSDIKHLINNKMDKNYLTSLKILDNIIFNDTIEFLNNLNCVYLIYIHKPQLINNTTKRINIKNNKKTKRKIT
jgi:hypothetical protein